jgi:hypothetical protein
MQNRTNNQKVQDDFWIHDIKLFEGYFSKATGSVTPFKNTIVKLTREYQKLLHQFDYKPVSKATFEKKV